MAMAISSTTESGDVGDTPLRQAIKQPTMSLNGPLQKHISLLANASSSSSSSSSSSGVSSDCPSFGFLCDGKLLWIMGLMQAEQGSPCFL